MRIPVDFFWNLQNVLETIEEISIFGRGRGFVIFFSLLVREVEIGIVLLPFLPSCLSFFVSYNERFIRNYHAIFSFDG